MPQTPFGGGSIVAPIWPMPPLMIVENALRSIASVIARRNSGLSNGGLWRLISIVRGTLTAVSLADRLRRLLLEVLQGRRA